MCWRLYDDVDPQSLQDLGVLTPLHCASTSDAQAAQLLLSHGASLENVVSVDFTTPLCVALKEGVTEVSDLLLAWGASLDRYPTHGGLHSDVLAAVIPEERRLVSKQF